MKKLKIELKAGYYEWNLFINDELFYTFDDLTELLYSDNDEITKNDLWAVIDDIIDTMKSEKEEEKEKINALTVDIQQAMFNGLKAHYGIN